MKSDRYIPSKGDSKRAPNQHPDPLVAVVEGQRPEDESKPSVLDSNSPDRMNDIIDFLRTIPFLGREIPGQRSRITRGGKYLKREDLYRRRDRMGGGNCRRKGQGHYRQSRLREHRWPLHANMPGHTQLGLGPNSCESQSRISALPTAIEIHRPNKDNQFHEITTRL
ncbi:MAG TPA: hypothetical protein VKG78_00360 [Opitutaceae bacterium]|nr:hypothetical protein [Opitutaceae bacterium]